MKRLRNPCEHVDEMHPYGHYVEHELGEWTGIRNTPDGPEQYLEIRICPGGEFLPEDAELLRTISEHFMAALAPFRSEMKAGDLVAVCNAHARQVLDALAPDQVGEPG